MTEQKPIFYNRLYSKGGHNKEYFKKPENSIYFPLWNRILSILDKSWNLADFGCGAGQFANLALNNGVNYVLGIDFSSKAIRLARKRNPGHEKKFLKMNLYNKRVYSKVRYDIALFSEVFEHLERDLFICSLLESGTRIFVSLPSFDSESHVRFFKDEDEIVKRYQNNVEIDDISIGMKIKNSDKKIFLVQGKVK